MFEIVSNQNNLELQLLGPSSGVNIITPEIIIIGVLNVLCASVAIVIISI
jgi:hypothetical protein